MTNTINNSTLDKALGLLAQRLHANHAPAMRLVVCGGSALIATGLNPRTTKDVDVVALLDGHRDLLDPDPLPTPLIQACAEVAAVLGLEADWLNNGPSRGDGGLFRMGLPAGFAGRLQEVAYGPGLTVFYISRVDQIHFKLYASVDRGGYHISDLLVLAPTDDELAQAARWIFQHDVSEDFRILLKGFLRSINHDAAADRV